MNVEEYEQLSALVDDELIDEASSAINTLIDNDETKEIWYRYHLISDAMRGRLPESIVDVTGAVKNNTYSLAKMLPLKKSPLNFVKPLTGFAVIASMLVIVILLNI